MIPMSTSMSPFVPAQIPRVFQNRSGRYQALAFGSMAIAGAWPDAIIDPYTGAEFGFRPNGFPTMRANDQRPHVSRRSREPRPARVLDCATASCPYRPDRPERRRPGDLRSLRMDRA